MKRKRTNSGSFIYCSLCEGIRSWVPKPAFLPRLWRIGCGRWKVRKSALVGSAAHGCETCGFLVRAIKASNAPLGLTGVRKVYFQLSHSVPQLRVQLVPTDVEFYLTHPAHYAGYEPFGHGILQSPMQPRPASLGYNIDQMVRTIEKWMLNCLDCHPNCRSGNFWPNRLIDVGFNYADTASDPVRIVSLSHCEPYMTLSHCWGDTQHALTTKANYCDRQASIPMAELSKTFQDAVWLTRRLGIRYLWIDSLCIIQDDPNDWTREAATMSRIYAASYLTIAASHGADGSAGIFVETQAGDERRSTLHELEHHPHPDEPSVKVTIEQIPGRSKTKKGEPNMVHELYGDIGEITKPSYRDSGLLTRAWAFQERSLSTRIVHFTQAEMVWECTNERRCECGGIAPQPFITSLMSSVEARTAEMDAEEEEKKAGDLDRKKQFKSNVLPRLSDSALDLWLAFVQYYSTRNLTKPEDRGPAFAGIANIYGRMMREQGGEEDDPGEYWDGLWENHLPFALLWTCSRRLVQDKRENHKRPIPARIRNTTAPSWSWYSAVGECWLLRRPFEKLIMTDLRVFPLEDELLDIEEIEFEYDHTNHALTLTGVPLATAIRLPRSGRFKLKPDCLPTGSQMTENHEIVLIADDEEDDNFDGELVCMTLAQANHPVILVHPPPNSLAIRPRSRATGEEDDKEIEEADFSDFIDSQRYDPCYDEPRCVAHTVGVALVAMLDRKPRVYRRIGLFITIGCDCGGEKFQSPMWTDNSGWKLPFTETKFVKHWMECGRLDDSATLV